MDGREMGSTYVPNDNQFVSICTSPIELIQNISQRRDRKPDGCDAGGARFFAKLGKSRVGMNVALSRLLSVVGS